MNIVVIVALIIAAILIRVGLGYIDKDNIHHAARKKRWQIISIEWAPFGPGTFFEEAERSYLLNYLDIDGKKCTVYCKTSLFTGVFWRD